MGGADDRERLREMLSALEAKQRLVDLLNAYIDARQESVRVVFDLEEQAPEMAGLVLIAARARLGGERRGALGTVGVIGPKRMQYERTMNAVGYIAQVLERQGFGFVRGSVMRSGWEKMTRWAGIGNNSSDGPKGSREEAMVDEMKDGAGSVTEFDAGAERVEAGMETGAEETAPEQRLRLRS